MTIPNRHPLNHFMPLGLLLYSCFSDAFRGYIERNRWHEPDLTHSFPIHSFPTSWKHQKTLWFFYALGRRESVHWECMGNVFFYLLLPHNHPILGLPTFSPFQSFYVANHCTPIYDGLDIMPRVVKKSHPLHLFYEYLSLLP